MVDFSISTLEMPPRPRCTKIPMPLWQPPRPVPSLKLRMATWLISPDAFWKAIPKSRGAHWDRPLFAPSTIKPSMETPVVPATRMAAAMGKPSSKLVEFCCMAPGIRTTPLSGDGQRFANGHLLGVIPFANANRCPRRRRVHGVLNPCECSIRAFHLIIVHDELRSTRSEHGQGQKQDEQCGQATTKPQRRRHFHQGLPSPATLREMPVSCAESVHRRVRKWRATVAGYSLRAQGLRLEVRM